MNVSLLSLANPWWENPSWQQTGIDREIFKKFYKSVKDTNFVTVLEGSRQSGKTFLLKQTITALLKAGINRGNIYYFLLDDPELSSSIAENPTAFGKFLQNESVQKGKLFVFIDEFQKVPNVTNIIKLFYESTPDVKFIITGSSALQIKDKVSESLLGRTQSFLLYPFSFKEYLDETLKSTSVTFPTSELTNLLKSFLISPKDYFDDLLNFYQQYKFAFDIANRDYLPNYLLTGGYPQAALANTSNESFLRLREIKQTFIEKDIVALLRIEKLREFDKVMRLLALQSGQLLNYNDLQITVGVNYQTLISFFNVLNSTHLWNLVPVFTTNKITSLKKRPKSYFNDLGLRNLLVSTLDESQLLKEKGVVMENFVYNQLTKFKSHHLDDLGEIFYWRSPDGNEVDFLLEYKKKLLPIEVKSGQVSWPINSTVPVKIARGLQTFLHKTQIDIAIIFNETELGRRQIKGKEYYLLPLAILAGI